MIAQGKVLGLAALLTVAFAASAGRGALSYVDVSVGSLTVPADLVDVYSYSYGYTLEGLGNSSTAGDPQDHSFASFADAMGLWPQARAQAGTAAGYVSAMAYASTSGLVDSRAYAEAKQFWYLNVASTGSRAFTSPYSVDWDLQSGPGETAYGDSYLGLFLFDSVTGDLLEEASESGGWLVENGGSDSSLGPYSSSLTLTYDFPTTGCYTLMLYADAEAIAVPVPGAALLGGLGVGFAGWLLRRREASRAICAQGREQEGD